MRAKHLITMIGMALLASLLAGCHSDAYYDAQAPSPMLNPHPHRVSYLKIRVEPGSGVNRVEVYSTWMISNLGCAPRRWPSGSTIQKEVEVKEKVEEIDDYYLATIRDDYYLPGKCKWLTGAAWASVRFMHNYMRLASGEGGSELFRESNPLKLVCIPPPHAPICELRNRETFDRAHFKGVFNATLELEQ
ncbi:MAG: hypothetical protein ACREPY_08860 [Rhodanobacteraceae bacterium]